MKITIKGELTFDRLIRVELSEGTTLSRLKKLAKTTMHV